MQKVKDWHNVKIISEICVIAPTQLLAEKFISIINDENYTSVDVVMVSGGRDSIIECAKTIERKGAKIIISRKGTQQIVEENTNTEVIGITYTLIEYLNVLKSHYFDNNGLVAFFTYVPMSEDVLKMCEMLEIKVKNYIFKSIDDCERCVKEAIKDKAVYAVGGAWTDPIAWKYGLPHSILENSIDMIKEALETAMRVSRIKKEEEEKRLIYERKMETYRTVLDFTHDGILSIDENGIIQVINPVAEKIMKCDSKIAVGKDIDEFLPNSLVKQTVKTSKKKVNQIVEIKNVKTNSNVIPIIVDNKTLGAVATFQDVKQLQTAEQSVRIKLHEKGLVAKYNFSDIIGSSNEIKNTIKIAKSYAMSGATVLIYGETGTGKEIFAQSIHNESDRRRGPFVAVNCASMNDSLLESELFGYEAGSFTGALKEGRVGLFELAHGGTIFLDEIGEIPKETQVELLRVIQEKEVRRVGGNNFIPIDVRVITATNKDLLQETIDGRFREDLYYRLNVLDLKLPSLRERGNDAELIAMDLFKKLPHYSDDKLDEFKKIYDKVKDYKWYGNIRELQNFVERSNIFINSSLDTERLTFDMNKRKIHSKDVIAIKDVDEIDGERKMIEEALKKNNSIEGAAKSLGYSRQTLWRRMKKYSIRK